MQERIPRPCDQSTTYFYKLKRSWNATDAAGNTAFATSTLTILDLEKPEFQGVPVNMAVTCERVPPPPVVTATDNDDVCFEKVVQYRQTRTSDSSSCRFNYTLTRTWAATDPALNAHTEIRTVKVGTAAASEYTVEMSACCCCYVLPTFVCCTHDTQQPTVAATS